MKKVPQILLIFLFGWITSLNAQVILDSDSIMLEDSISLQTMKWVDSMQFESDRLFDSLKIEYNKYKRYIISTDSIKAHWLKVRIGFNYPCDTLFFHNNYYNLQSFDKEFKDFLLSKSATDTVVLQIDHGDSFNIGNMLSSFEILAVPINKYIGHGIYYFNIYTPPREKEKFVKTDTIDLFVDKVIKYNGAIVNKADLSSLLQINKPEMVIIRADNELTIQDLIDILQLGNELKIKMVLGKK
jgi:hypothetical protein